MKKEAKKNYEEFSGKVKMISSSPHGDAEGVVLESGEFIKIPPHSLQNAKKLKIGSKVKGSGEKVEFGESISFHHTKVFMGSSVISDDQLGKNESEELKDRHKLDNDKKKKTQAPPQKVVARSKIAALLFKPKGELDRIMLEDGTSVHVPKELHFSREDFAVGDPIEVKGDGQTFPGMKFLKAKKIRGISFTA